MRMLVQKGVMVVTVKEVVAAVVDCSVTVAALTKDGMAVTLKEAVVAIPAERSPCPVFHGNPDFVLVLVYYDN